MVGDQEAPKAVGLRDGDEVVLVGAAEDMLGLTVRKVGAVVGL